MTISLDVELLGAQIPTHLSLPAAVSSAGREAVDLAASAGLHLDPWECFVLDHALAERADGRWAALDVGLIVPRQNGKGSVIEALELAGLFLFEERLILHSAHEFKTAQEAFLRVRSLVEGTPDLSRRVKSIPTAHGKEGIELMSGQRLKFVARSKGSGRGFSGDRVILDEAFNLSSKAISAMYPTMAARPNPQIWYTSSAPLDTEESTVLRKLCRRGRAGTSPRLAYLEWCAAVDRALKPVEREAAVAVALDDREAWAQANPGLGIRIMSEFVESEREALDDEDFARERLGIWRDEDVERVFSEATWDLVNSPHVRPDGALTFGADVNLERSAAGISVVSADGEIELVDHIPAGKLVARATEINERQDSPPWAVDGSSSAPIASYLPELREAGLAVVEVPAGDIPAACGRIYDRINAEQVRVRRHPSLDAAVVALVKRDVGDAWRWDRKGGADIAPFMAVTVADWLAGELSAPNIY